jgi:hypothetical protein
MADEKDYVIVTVSIKYTHTYGPYTRNVATAKAAKWRRELPDVVVSVCRILEVSD